MTVRIGEQKPHSVSVDKPYANGGEIEPWTTIIVWDEELVVDTISWGDDNQFGMGAYSVTFVGDTRTLYLGHRAVVMTKRKVS